MNEYHAIARQYFQRVEGWHLYRVQGDGMLWLWLVIAVAWGISFIPLLMSVGDLSQFWRWLVLVLVLEMVVLAIGGINQKRKREALADSVNEEFGVQVVQEDECRALLLMKLVDRPRHEFLATAKEIRDLLALRNEFRGGQELEAGSYLRHVYDPDSKARLLAVTLAAITVITALTLRSAPEGLAIIELFSSPSLLRALGTLVLLSASVFVIAVGLRAMFRVVWGATTIWVAKTIPSKESTTALRRLARDLVLLHSLEKSTMTQHDDREVGANLASRRTGEVTLPTRRQDHLVRGLGVGALIGWAAHLFLSTKRRSTGAS